ncbi:staphylocoagulase repeat protein [Gracilaria domingensis]|nr:staphylocoagulase repeat protein [Gracilaria domingensis]
MRTEPSSMLNRLSVALTPTDDTDRFLLPAVPSTRCRLRLASVDQLLSLASDQSATVFDQRDVSSVMSLSVADERQDGLLATLQTVSRRARADADAADVADAAPPANDVEPADALQAEIADAANADNDAADAAAADKGADADAPASQYARKLYHPKLTYTQLAGLLVGLVFLICRSTPRCNGLARLPTVLIVKTFCSSRLFKEVTELLAVRLYRSS